MTKPTMWLCAQRRLRSAWASAQSDQSLSFALKWVAKDTSFLHADSEDSDQPGLWSDWADAQADLSLRWAPTHFVGFVTRQLIFEQAGLRHTSNWSGSSATFMYIELIIWQQHLITNQWWFFRMLYIDFNRVRYETMYINVQGLPGHCPWTTVPICQVDKVHGQKSTE